MWVTWVRGLRGCMGAWVTWVQLLRGLRWLGGSKYFLRGSKFFAWVFAWVQNFCLGQFFGGSSKKISIGAFTITS